VHGGADPRPSCIPAPPRNTDGIAASVLMLTSSGEDQTSRDGVFSRALLNLWEGGSYDGSYCDLYWHLRDHGVRECSQTTHIFMLGAADLDFPLVPAFRPVPSVVLRGG
ncbi:MAG TPA: hypothetical protein VFR37_08265, partial [Longimicrobium sp.]|nr:hypothetical protein [Longimicrobium sp.]